MVMFSMRTIVLILIILCFGCASATERAKQRNAKINEQLAYAEKITASLESKNKALTDALEASSGVERDIICDANSVPTINTNLKALFLNELNRSVIELDAQKKYMSEDQKNRLNILIPRITPLALEPTLCKKY